jgi:hypothetical protein
MYSNVKKQFMDSKQALVQTFKLHNCGLDFVSCCSSYLKAILLSCSTLNPILLLFIYMIVHEENASNF